MDRVWVLTSWVSFNGIMTLDEEEIPMNNHFKFLSSIIQKDGEINSDVNHRIQADWLKWRSATRILCHRNIPL